MPSAPITALALYSGGLDSTLACRVVAAQGIRVIALKFVSPFFGYNLLARQEEHITEVLDTYGIDLRIIDVTDDYLKLLRNPVHGYGKHFNPCIDCKILLLTKAREMMPAFGASFLVTGEVVGQRPMSQRPDTLRVIERDSGCEDLLVRPLCAKNLKPGKPELDGLINRNELLSFNGRNRKPQIELAARLGITNYPSPGGGCLLTDPVQAARIKKYYNEHQTIVKEDILLLMIGRQFRLPDGAWLVVGHNQSENEKIEAMQQPGDWLLRAEDRPGPTVLLRGLSHDNDLQCAARIVARYAKKSAALPKENIVRAETNNELRNFTVLPIDETLVNAWRQ